MTVRDINDLTKEELIALYFKQQDIHKKEMAAKDQTIEEQGKKIKEQDKLLTEVSDQLAGANRNVEILLERCKLLIAAKYQSQRKAEVSKGWVQLSLFNDAEEEALKAQEEEKDAESEITVKEHKRKKTKKKETNFDDLEHVVETLEPTEEDRICPKCGGIRKIKSYEEFEELVYVPAKYYVRVTRVPVMECEQCQSRNQEGKSSYQLACADRRLKVIPGSYASPELLAHIITQKYDVGVPLYALEGIFKRDGIFLSREVLSYWICYIKRYLEPLYLLMHRDLLSHYLIHADETHTQVIKEPDRVATTTSFMWVFRTGANDTPIVLYVYSPSRSGEIPEMVLDGWSGLLETDAYTGYNKVAGAIRCLCNVHALRKFKDAYKLLPKDTSLRNGSDEAKAVNKYQYIFNIEHKIQKEADKRHLSGDQLYEYVRKQRQKRIRPVFDEFLVWLNKKKPLNEGKNTMTNAINYVLNNQEGLMRFIDFGEAPISNQITEQSIRPFVVIRNRCKFHFGMAGADVSAMLYSLMITARQNGRHPYGYFEYILEKLPSMDLTNEEELRKLLPYSDELPVWTKILNQREIKDILKGESQ